MNFFYFIFICLFFTSFQFEIQFDLWNLLTFVYVWKLFSEYDIFSICTSYHFSKLIFLKHKILFTQTTNSTFQNNRFFAKIYSQQLVIAVCVVVLWVRKNLNWMCWLRRYVPTTHRWAVYWTATVYCATLVWFHVLLLTATDRAFGLKSVVCRTMVLCSLSRHWKCTLRWVKYIWAVLSSCFMSVVITHYCFGSLIFVICV